MKKAIITFGLFITLLIGLNGIAAAQVCGSIPWLNQQVIPNVDIQLLNTAGQPVSSVSPSTNYILRVRATSGICGVSGSGCASGFAPVAFIIPFALGCTVDGRNITPPAVAGS